MLLNLNTNVNYTEDWYTETIRQDFDPATGRAITTSEPGFFSLRKFSAGVSGNTTIYGIFPYRLGRLDGFRHTIRPTASLSFAPDFTGDFWGYTRTYENATGEEIEYAIIRNAALGREQRTLSFSLSNIFESKLTAPDADTLDQRPQTLKLLDVDLSSSYNFAADSLNLSDVRLTARTSLFDRIHMNLTSSLSPYDLNDDRNRPINNYVFSPRGFRIARLTRLDLTARASFRSDRAQVGDPLDAPRARPSAMPGVGSGVPPYSLRDPFDAPYMNTGVGYADFAIPWSLDLSLTYGLSRPYADLTRRAIINTSFDFNLTPRWKVQGRSGYDVIRKEVVSTDLVILRDFDCWEMSFRWVPFGRFQSYSFDLHVKSGKLRDLLRIRQPRSEVRGRFSGLL